jgi:hypothetical protein
MTKRKSSVSTRKPASRAEVGFLEKHWKIATAISAAIIAILGVIPTLLPTPIFGRDKVKEPSTTSTLKGSLTTDLRIADLTANEAVAPYTSYTHDENSNLQETGKGKNKVEAVQIALRNNGDIPAFIKEVRLKFRQYNRLDECETYGDDVVVTSSTDVSLPTGDPDKKAPFVISKSMSYKVDAHGIDRLQLTFDSPGPTYIAANIDIELVQDGSQPPISAGTAILFLPPVETAGYFESLTKHPHIAPLKGCNSRNFAALRAVNVAPSEVLTVRSSSFRKALAAHSNFARGEYYSP